MNDKRRILIADDDEHVRTVIAEILTSFGHEVETASDGFEALAKLELDIDLVLTDAMMPGMDGFEVTTRIRSDSRFADLPIIMVTGSTDRRDRIRSAEAGVSDFITKPIDYTELFLRTSTLQKMKTMHDALKNNQLNLERKIESRTEALRVALEKVVEQQRHLHAANLETIHRLVNATEFKDRGTAAHIKRIGLIGALLARKLKLAPNFVELILYASPMHDIGKIGIPEELLIRPGPLNVDEWVKMRQHTSMGAGILEGSTFPILQMGERIAISHHERWNGTGYPNGLAGEDIPIEGRICAVADVFDALTSERPYKKAFSHKDAFEMIRSERGEHFDPTIADVLLGNIKEVVAIKERVG